MSSNTHVFALFKHISLLRFLPALVARAARRPRLLAAAMEHTLAELTPRRAYRSSKAPVCIVTHDAHRHGAQLLALELARFFSCTFGLTVHIVTLGPGPLKADFRRYGRVYELSAQQGPAAEALAHKLVAQGVRNALCNSTASGLFLETLAGAGVRCIALVHELPELIAARGFAPHADAIGRCATLSVFAADTVRDRFPGGAPEPSLIHPQGLARRRGPASPAARAAARTRLRRRFGIAEDAPLVLAAGYADARKGVDLFVDIGARVVARDPRARFLWVGGLAPEVESDIRRAAEVSGHADAFVFAPFARDLGPYYAGADVFALTSREDPFPTVLLEAQDAGLPAVAFQGAGGFEPLLAQGGGELAPAGDVDAFAAAVLALIEAPRQRARMGAAGSAAVSAGYSLRRYAFDLAHLMDAAPPRISVVVPSFNYARYLPARLRSIRAQTLPPYELIVLDDRSSDDSVAVARETLRGAPVDWRIIEGREKAGSVFAQWRAGVAAAGGDFIWIAEADDLADPRFLETTAGALSDPQVVLSYCQSRQIDASGRLLDTDYLTYVSDIGAERWRQAYVAEGAEEIRTALAVKNTIPNVSACVFRKDALQTALEQSFDEIGRFRIAGDWMTYVRTLAHGRIAYDPRALNLHRRHDTSVTASALAPAQALAEIADMQALVRAEFAPAQGTQDIAAAYLETLRRQFGLAPG